MVDKNRIPAADSQDFANWHLPEVATGHVVESVLGRGNRDPGNEVVARALTARQLEAITSQAQREGHAQGHGDGRREGLAMGLAEGRIAARQELAQQVQQLQSLMQQLQEPLDEQQGSIETALTQMALDIARAVLDREAAVSAEQLLPIVRKAVRELPVGSRNITVLLHPKQLELIKGVSEWPAHWQLQADSRIDVGGCRVVTEHGLVDYTVELRFRQVAAGLLAASAQTPLPEPGTLLDADDD